MAGKDKTIDRLWFEIGANYDPAIKAFEDAMKMLNDGTAKFTSNQARMATAAENALNPTMKLGERIEALSKAGMPAIDILRALNTELNRTIAIAKQNDKPLDPYVKGLDDLRNRLQSGIPDITKWANTMTEGVTSPMGALKNAAMAATAALGPVGTAIAAVGGFAVAAAAAQYQFIKSLSDEVVELRNHAIVTGETIQKYQALKRAGEELGVNTDMLHRQVGMMERSMATGVKADFIKVLNAFRLAAGESAATLENEFIPLIDDLGKRLAKMPDGFEKAMLGNAAFNRRLQDVLTLALLTKGHLGELVGKIEDSATYSDLAANKLLFYHNALMGIDRTLAGLKYRIVDLAFAIGWAFPNLEWLMGMLAKQAPGLPNPFVPVPGQAGTAPRLMSGHAPTNLALTGGMLPAHQQAFYGPQAVPAGTPSMRDLELQAKGLEYAKILKEGQQENKAIQEEILKLQDLQLDAVDKGIAGQKDYASTLDAVAASMEKYKIKDVEWFKTVMAYKAEQVEANFAEARWYQTEQERLQMFQDQLAGLVEAQSDAESEFNKKTAAGDYKAAQAAGARYAYIKKIIDGINEMSKTEEKYVTALTAQQKIQEEITTKGMGALGETQAARDAEAKRLTGWVTDSLRLQESIERELGRDVTKGKLEELRIEQQITNQIVPRNEYERESIEITKAGLEWAIKEEEINTKYAERRFNIESKIAELRLKPIVGQELAAQEAAKLWMLDKQRAAEMEDLLRLRSASILRAHAEAYKKMIDAYREYGGQLFDAIFSSGKKGFQAILDWLQNVFKNLLKQIFQNMFAEIFQHSGLYETLRKAIYGTFPTGGPSTSTVMGTAGNVFTQLGQEIRSGFEDLKDAIAPNFAGSLKWSSTLKQWIPEEMVTMPEYAGAAAGLGVAGLGVLQPQYLPEAANAAQGAASAGLFQGINWGNTLATLGMSAGGMLAIQGLQKKSTWMSTMGGGIMGAGLGYMMAPSLGLSGLAGMGYGAMAAGGAMLAIQGIRGHGAGSWAEALGGGAISGFGVAGPIGAAIGFLAAGIAKAIATATKSSSYAGSVEAMRDLGVNFSEAQFKGLYEGYGLNQDLAYGMRKEITFAPKSLQQMGALAKQQGTYDTFLEKLSKVETAWGTFDFRSAYEIGDVTGDWTALDKAFTDAFKDSKVLNENLPNWKEMLLVTGDAAKKAAQGFEELWVAFQQTGQFSQDLVDYLTTNKDLLDESAKSSKTFALQLDAARAAAEKFTQLKPLIDGFAALKSGLNSANFATKTIYDRFLETGELLPELSSQILEYGGDLKKFQTLADLAALNNHFAEMVQHFRETGEILPQLRDLVQQYGGDLAVLDQASELPVLMKSLAAIKELASGIGSLQKTTVQSILAGEWSPEVEQALRGMGLDPSRLQGITKLIGIEKGWDQAIQDFQTKMKYEWDTAYNKWVAVPVGLEKGGILESALKTYGGAEGLAAIANWSKGFNTVTPDLLAKTKSAADLAYENETTAALDYLGQAEDTTNQKITTLTNTVAEQLDIAANNIATAMDAAKKDVVAELDLILDAINKVVKNTADAVIEAGTPATSGNNNTVPGTNVISGNNATGPDYSDVPGYVYQPGLPRGKTTDRYAAPTIVIEGPIYGYDEFSAKVETAAIMLRRRGSPAFSTS